MTGEHTQVKFKNSRELELVGILSESPGSKSAVVLCHGFGGYKEMKLLHSTAEAIRSRGISVLRFDFSDCMLESEGDCKNLTVTNQIDDIGAAFDYLEAQGFEKIGIAGHSLGGFDSIIFSVKDSRPKAVVTFGAIASARNDVFFRDHIEEWKTSGHKKFSLEKWGEVEIPYTFYEDFKKYDASELIKEMKAPIRIIHGKQDKIVTMLNAEQLFDNAAAMKDVRIIMSAGHMFSEEFEQTHAAKMAAEWFEEFLLGKSNKFKQPEPIGE
ncbi:TPA: prolyl oligopeptidase family serine peptidase [archaeon]|jgi:esterase/lipase|uniref:Prolyl oligopeptidase family serine peptidase n=1 Tax=Candidatus Undinarchaeum marinum TaxID=2756141 RepID=A0A832V460_9ARCH|nr:prolyl oligopeptidase family serine peptidase [Candidatus Undinarchaeum marinum]